MALVQRMNTFGTRHPSLNFLSGVAAGAALIAAVAYISLTPQSDTQAAIPSFVQSSIGEEWAAPRVLVSTAGTYDIARTQAEDETLSAERVVVSAEPAVIEEASILGGLSLEQAAAIDEALFEGSGVFDGATATTAGSSGTAVITDEQLYGTELEYRTTVGIAEAAVPAADVSFPRAMDEALFEGAGVFDGTTSAPSSVGTSVISDEQAYLLEQEYRFAVVNGQPPLEVSH